MGQSVGDFRFLEQMRSNVARSQHYVARQNEIIMRLALHGHYGAVSLAEKLLATMQERLACEIAILDRLEERERRKPLTRQPANRHVE